MTLAFKAMEFARRVHAGHKRKYTGNPYTDHLAEVAGIAMSVGWQHPQVHPDAFMAVCWLHDCVEDQAVTFEELYFAFGEIVTAGVRYLSDLEEGNRAYRKAASRARLAQAPNWVQTIKVADLISNTSSIVQHDPKFAVTYLEEKRLLLDVLTKADPRLVAIAREQVAVGAAVAFVDGPLGRSAERDVNPDDPEPLTINQARAICGLRPLTADEVDVDPDQPDGRRFTMAPWVQLGMQTAVDAVMGPGYEVVTRPAHGGYPDPDASYPVTSMGRFGGGRYGAETKGVPMEGFIAGHDPLES